MIATIEDVQQKGQVKATSVYFRDLNTDESFSLGGSIKYAPASLMKVPIMLSYFLKAQDDKQLLQNKILFEEIPQQDNNQTRFVQYYTPPEALQTGEYYSIDDLIGRMIRFSDNQSKDLLLANMNHDDLDQIYMLIGLSRDVYDWRDGYVTIGDYSIFFRMLYNASLLDNEYSEKALSLLAQSTFKEGLVAGVASGVQIAHKFGEYGDLLQAGDFNAVPKQLHDCGIVYNNENPYLLCVMTKGTDYKALIGVIADISKVVYEGLQVK